MVLEAAPSGRNPTRWLPSPVQQYLLPSGLAVGVVGWLELLSARGSAPGGDIGVGGDGNDDDDNVRLCLTTSAYVGYVGPAHLGLRTTGVKNTSSSLTAVAGCYCCGEVLSPDVGRGEIALSRSVRFGLGAPGQPKCVS